MLGYTALIRLDSTMIGSRQWPNGTRKWTVTLRNPDGESFTFPYHTGPAITEEPTFKDVVQAAITDAQCYEMNPNFEDFADEFGYDTDSISALESFNACREMSEQVHRLFGNDLDAIAEATAE